MKKIGEIWRADAETGDLSQFDRIVAKEGNIFEVVTSPVIQGNCAFHAQLAGLNAECCGQKTFAEQNIIHFQIPIYISSDFDVQNWCRPFELRAPNGDKIIYMDIYTANRWQLVFPNLTGRGNTGTQPSLSADGYHVIDVYAVLATNGSIRVLLDGVLVFEQMGGLDFTGKSVNLAQFGNISAGGTVTGNLFYDGVLLEEWLNPPTPPNQAPLASMVYSPINPTPNEQIMFSASNSKDLDGQIVAYNWDFGDGTTGEGVNILKTYGQEGIYTVTLTVTDDGGLTGNINASVGVASPAPPQPPVGWALPLRVEGKKIFDVENKDVTLQLSGVGKMGLEYNPGTFRETDPAYYASDADRMKIWGVRIARVAFNRYWFMTDNEYRGRLKQLVDMLAERGILILMDLHWYGEAPYSEQPPPGWVTLPLDDAWLYADNMIDCLVQVARFFLYQPMVMGVEINEFRCYIENYNKMHFRHEWAAKLADSVHQINPNLLVGVEFQPIHEIPEGTDIDYCKSLIRPNMFYAAHIYFAEFFGYNAIWQMYASDPIAGKQQMYNIMDTRFAPNEDVFNVPVIVTEWGSNGVQGQQVVKDQFDYFIAHNWGQTYWAYMGNAGTPGDAYGMALLSNDWQTPSFVGNVFIETLARVPSPPAPPTPKPSCFIASVVYGSPLAQELNILRHFRNRCLPDKIIHFYYTIGPCLAQLIKRRETIKRYVRTVLNLFVKLYGRG